MIAHLNINTLIENVVHNEDIDLVLTTLYFLNYVTGMSRLTCSALLNSSTFINGMEIVLQKLFFVNKSKLTITFEQMVVELYKIFINILKGGNRVDYMVFENSNIMTHFINLTKRFKTKETQIIGHTTEEGKPTFTDLLDELIKSFYPTYLGIKDHEGLENLFKKINSKNI
eukprot:UN29821